MNKKRLLTLMGGSRKTSNDWWSSKSVNLSDCVAAYSPKGAADYAASLINLANPGTYNASGAAAPAWDVDNGWKGDGTKSLTTGITPTSLNYSMLVRCTNLVHDSGEQPVVLSVGTGYKFGFQASATSNRTYFFHGSGAYTNGAGLTGGVLAISGNIAYLNGSQAGTITLGSIGTPAVIKALIGSFGFMSVAYIQALVIYNIVLTPTQVATISASMAAL